MILDTNALSAFFDFDARLKKPPFFVLLSERHPQSKLGQKQIASWQFLSLNLGMSDLWRPINEASRKLRSSIRSTERKSRATRRVRISGAEGRPEMKFMSSHLGVFLLAAGVLCLSTSIALANIVVNGSFEESTTTDPTTGDVLPAGWTLGPPSPATLSKVNVDSATNPATDLGPEDASHYLRFQSPSTNGSRDCVLQDLNTIANQQYTVSF